MLGMSMEPFEKLAEHGRCCCGCAARCRYAGTEPAGSFNEALRTALVALAPTQRRSVVLHHLAGLPHAIEAKVALLALEAAARASVAVGARNARSIVDNPA